MSALDLYLVQTLEPMVDTSSVVNKGLGRSRIRQQALVHLVEVLEKSPTNLLVADSVAKQVLKNPIMVD